MPFSRFWDISLPLTEGMIIWPGDTPFATHVRHDQKGDQNWSNTEIRMGCHTGTHMDAPRHVFGHGATIGSFPLSTLVGRCLVVETDGETIDAELIRAVDPVYGGRVLFKTNNTDLFADGVFHESYVHFDPEAAQALVEAQVVLVGTDGPSVDPYGQGLCPAHTAFCEAGIAVIENLALRNVDPGEYTLICLPIRLDQCDGAPVRAILAR